MPQRRSPALAAACALLAFFCVRAGVAAWQKTPTYDEPYHIAAGYTMLAAGDFRMRHSKPALSLELLGLPLLATPATFDPRNPDWLASDWRLYADEQASYRSMYSFALDFVYRNAIPPQELVFLSRLASLAQAALLGVLVFWTAARLFGDGAALCALALFALEPNLTAYAALANQDMPATAACFAAMAAFHFLLEKPTPRRGAVWGTAMAAALLSKFTALLLFPAAAAVWLLRGRPRLPARALGAAAAGAAALVLLCYRVTRVAELGRALLANDVIMSQGENAFFHGIVHGGVWYYFIGAFLLKTPLPLIILAVPALLAPGAWTDPKRSWLAVPVVLLMAAASFSRLQLGLRYILPIYPFLIVLAGEAASRVRPRVAAAALLCWLAFSSLRVQPDFLAYFNELAGGTAGGWRWLVDSNLDWGQDLAGLQEDVRAQGASDVILSYYGFVPVDAVGFPFQDLFSLELRGPRDHVNGPAPSKELLAVSATNLQGVYLSDAFGANPLAWLKDKPPARVIGGSIFVWDVTGDADVHRRLAHAYLVAGRPALARRELARVLRLGPPDAWTLVMACFLAPSRAEGLRLFSRAAALDASLGLPEAELAAQPRARAWYETGLRRVARAASRASDRAAAGEALERLAARDVVK